MQHDLSENVAVDHFAERRGRVGKRVGGVDDGVQVGVFHEFEQSCEIVTRTHGVALHANVLEEDAGQFGSRLVSCGGSADGDGAAGAYGFDGMAPGGRADRFDDGVDLMRQSRAGFEGGVGSDGDRGLVSLRCVT